MGYRFSVWFGSLAPVLTPIFRLELCPNRPAGDPNRRISSLLYQSFNISEVPELLSTSR